MSIPGYSEWACFATILVGVFSSEGNHREHELGMCLKSSRNSTETNVARVEWELGWGGEHRIQTSTQGWVLQALEGLGVRRREMDWRVWRKGILHMLYRVALSATGSIDPANGKNSRRDVRYHWILDDLDGGMC